MRLLDSSINFAQHSKHNYRKELFQWKVISSITITKTDPTLLGLIEYNRRPQVFILLNVNP